MIVNYPTYTHRCLFHLGEGGRDVGLVLPCRGLPDGLRRPHLLLGAAPPLLRRPLLRRLHGVLVRVLLRAVLCQGGRGWNNSLISLDGSEKTRPMRSAGKHRGTEQIT